MGRFAYGKASIGIKILISKLLSQINEDNKSIILDIFKNGLIEGPEAEIYVKEGYGSISELYYFIIQELFYDKLNEELENNEMYNLDIDSIKLNINEIFTKYKLIKYINEDKIYLLLPIDNKIELEVGYPEDRTISTTLNYNYNYNFEKYEKISDYEIALILNVVGCE